GHGTFRCPACQGPHPYTRVVVGRVMRIFAIQLPAGIYGEYVECRTCLSTFRPAVLAFHQEQQRSTMSAEYERALRRVLALLVITDGQIHDAEITTVQRVYSAVTGSQLSRQAVIEEAKEVADNPTSAARYLSE